jgi:D-alanine-D-alanine ligase
MTRAVASLFKFSLSKNLKIKVWVLAPAIESKDEHIDYYYDFTQSIAEYTAVFKTLNILWEWKEINMNNFKAVINEIDSDRDGFFPVALNLCDGDEINDTPGVSVIKYLEEKEMVYTGSDEFFYNITTSKIPMKRAFDKAGVSNAVWTFFRNKDEFNAEEILNKTGVPVIIKPAVSGGSMGVGIKNVVDNKEELTILVDSLLDGYRGWNLNADGIIAERFITGPEFTVFISGSYDRPNDAVIYTPVERVFHQSLPDKEKFLSFDRLWEIYETESPMPQDENFYEYQLPDPSLIDSIKQLSWDAYVATKGMGYTRVDIRMDLETNKLYVLEVNAQCGISEDENFTSIGAILKFSGRTFSQLIEEILNDAIKRGYSKIISYVNNNKKKAIRS